jgi:flagellar biosynthesis protein FlhF
MDMNLQTFRAPTMAECLSEVKRVMGPDAVILHTRTLTLKRFLGLRRREIVEITAGRGLNGGPRGPRRAVSGPRPMEQGGRNDGPMQPRGGNNGNVATLPPPRESLPPPRPMPDPSYSPDSSALRDLMTRVDSMARNITDLHTIVRSKDAPEVPEELFDEYMQLIDARVEKGIAEEIVKTLHRTLRPDHLQQRQFVREKIAEQLERMLPVSGPIARSKTSGPHVVALIGPTGVGKTTTIAKLAAKLKLDENRRIGLVTIDTYRIAAVDQLKKYADIIGSPLRVVHTPEELREAVLAMRDCDFVLIDTAGRSPKDTLKLNELRTFLEAASPEEVHLVLSATADRDCVDLAIDCFGKVRVDKLIFTKLDEARHVGALMSVVRNVRKPLSYVTTGQGVPADIEVARGKRIAQLILGSDL